MPFMPLKAVGCRSTPRVHLCLACYLVSGLAVEAVFADLQGVDKVHILDKGDI